MKREALENGGAIQNNMKKEEDAGLLKVNGHIVKLPFLVKTGDGNSKVRAKVKILDKLFNAIRYAIKDTLQVTLSPYFAHPK